MKIKKITIIALFVSIFVIFSKFLTFAPYVNFKISFKAMVIYISSILMNMKEGVIIALLGELLNQITSEYGITITTILWILPYVIIAILSNIVLKKIYKNVKFELLTIISLNILLTILNTIVIYIDSKIFGYYSPILVFGSLLIKIVTGVLTAIIYTIVINTITEKLKRIMY